MEASLISAFIPKSFLPPFFPPLHSSASCGRTFLSSCSVQQTAQNHLKRPSPQSRVAQIVTLCLMETLGGWGHCAASLNPHSIFLVGISRVQEPLHQWDPRAHSILAVQCVSCSFSLSDCRGTELLPETKKIVSWPRVSPTPGTETSQMSPHPTPPATTTILPASTRGASRSVTFFVSGRVPCDVIEVSFPLY